MRWVGLGADVVLACLGVWLLLTAYRVIGKPPGADEKYDAAMARQGTTYKTIGWCELIMAIIGLLDHLFGGLL
jgi:hypothetical protein